VVKYDIYGPGNSVGIATGYGLDGPGIESRWGRDFTHLSRSAQGPTQSHNILSIAPQLGISQKALGTLPDDGNVMPKHVGATIRN
jgi:hypothetical protein